MFESHLMTLVPLTVGNVVGGTSYNNSKERMVFFLILVSLLILMLLYDKGSAFIANIYGYTYKSIPVLYTLLKRELLG